MKKYFPNFKLNNFKITLLLCFFLQLVPNFCLIQDLSLNKGFQLISCELDQIDLSKQNLGNQIVIFWQFDSNLEKYQFYTNDQSTKNKLLSFQFEEFQNLIENRSYFAFSDEATHLQLNGNTLASKLTNIQFTKSQEVLYLSNPHGFQVEDFGTAYDSIWVMRNQNWHMYSPDTATRNNYDKVSKIQSILSNEAFIIISKNASLLQLPSSSFPVHFGLEQGLKINLEESYGYSFSKDSPRVKWEASTDPSIITSTQDLFIEWLQSKSFNQLLINPLNDLNDHYFSSSELTSLGLIASKDNFSFCQFLTKLRQQSVHIGIDFSNLVELNKDSYLELNGASSLPSKLSTNTLISIVRSFESSACPADYLYSASIAKSLFTSLQNQSSLAVYSQDNPLDSTKSIKSIKQLSDSAAFYQPSSFPITLLENQDLSISFKNALYYSRFKENSHFLYSTLPSLSLTQEFSIFDAFPFSNLAKFNNRYKIESSNQSANIVLLGLNAPLSLEIQNNLSNIIKIFHSLAYKVSISYGAVQNADLYYILHNNNADLSPITTLLSNDKIKFWQELSNPLVLPIEIINHFQISLNQVTTQESSQVLNYQSQNFQFSQTNSQSILLKKEDMSTSVSEILSSANNISSLFYLNNLYYVNASHIDQQLLYVMRSLLNSDGLIKPSDTHYSMIAPPIFYSPSNSLSQIQISSDRVNLEEIKDLKSISYGQLTSSEINFLSQSFYFLSSNHAPVTSLIANYTFLGSELISIPSTRSDLDLDSLSYQWQQISGSSLQISDPYSETLRV
ncbi:hypothetical protein MJH12_02025, partial [bacterium]|nr:hypothetical protein [bacterium]